jgi:hypothetical protein
VPTVLVAPVPPGGTKEMSAAAYFSHSSSFLVWSDTKGTYFMCETVLRSDGYQEEDLQICFLVAIFL